MAWIEGRSRIVWLIAAIVIITASTVVIIRHYMNDRMIPDSQVVRDFFVDDATLQEERHTAFEIPPIITQDGRTVVMAMKCQIDGKPQLWYLKKYPPETKALFEQDIKDHGKPDPLLYMAHGGEALVRRPEAGSPWVTITSLEGQKVIQAPLDSQGHVAMPYMPQ